MNQSNQRKHPNDPRCIECTGLTGLFLAARLSREADPRFRELLKSCAGCKKDYTDSVNATAQMARGLKETRQRKAIDRDNARRRQTRVRVLSQSTGQSPRSRRFHLQLMVIPALLIWGMMQFQTKVVEPIVAHVVWNQGEVNAGGTSMDRDIASYDLKAGDVIEMHRGALAQIEVGQTTIALKGPGQWMLEPGLGRIRMFHGRASIAAEESVVIVTSKGLATFSPASTGEVELAKLTPTLQCETGSVQWQSAAGKVLLGAGDRWPTRTASR